MWILEFIIICGVVLFFWVVGCLLLQIMYLIIGLNYFKINLPKRKKYNNKVDPIYEIQRGSYDDHYSVSKWELKYGLNEGLTWLCDILIPLPFVIYTYGYQKMGWSFKICELNEINTITSEYMVEFFEESYQKELKELEEHRDKSRKKTNQLDNLNKVFNENYE